MIAQHSIQWSGLCIWEILMHLWHFIVANVLFAVNFLLAVLFAVTLLFFQWYSLLISYSRRSGRRYFFFLLCVVFDPFLSVILAVNFLFCSRWYPFFQWYSPLISYFAFRVTDIFLFADTLPLFLRLLFFLIGIHIFASVFLFQLLLKSSPFTVYLFSLPFLYCLPMKIFLRRFQYLGWNHCC